MERQGVRYYGQLAQRQRVKLSSPNELPPDTVLRRKSALITFWGGLVAFLIGAGTTVITVWVEVEFERELAWYSYYSLQGSITILLLIVELAVLFWVAVRTVHALARLAGLTHTDDEPLLPGPDNVPNLLARAALEIPDPVVQFMGIDPLRKASKLKLVATGVLYKAKIFLSNAGAKFLAQRILGKGAARVSVSWVAVPITGLWNWLVLWKVAREARLRLFGYWLVHHLTREVLTEDRFLHMSTRGKLVCIRAVAVTMVLTQRYHPNMLMLLNRLATLLNIQDGDDYDNLAVFYDELHKLEPHERWFVLDLLCVAVAMDGRLTKLERKYLQEAFGEHTEQYYTRIRHLVKQLRRGSLHEALADARLDFVPG
jgi:hypothetical protein